MVVHYLESILLGTLATIVYVLAFRRRSITLELLSALLYFGAMLAKVIAAPLPLLLLILPENTLRVRARHLIFHGVALAGYFVWRYQVIGTIFGGYGWAISPRELPQLLAMLPWKVILAFAGAGIGVGLVAVGLLSIGVALAIRTRQALLFAGVTLLFAILPIIPVSKQMQSWYAVLPWLWLCCVFALGAAKLKTVVAGAAARRRGRRGGDREPAGVDARVRARAADERRGARVHDVSTRRRCCGVRRSRRRRCRSCAG